MSLAAVILGAVSAQRLFELALARRNTRRLLARGGVESGAGHYPVIVALHLAWLAGLWGLAWDRPVMLGWLAVYLGLEALRAWTMVSLGARWTTRIVTVPGEPLVRRGPYRFVAHPNYLVVAGELAVLPLAFGMPAFALVFTLLNAALMWIRIRAETAALRASSGQPFS